ncbi:hypothetical protein QET40_04340 [Akkermansia sp. N21169]|uniref:hypothetical protein n=1 Tax=Akkermansia sp. N21169 TaxID=3040765 RepID=UPI00244EABFA|nr:hypothetical protein [Akkermansia sp. N21169]MDH3068337.1 hypothetical protein [Akkermansia sp. N21169]
MNIPFFTKILSMFIPSRNLRHKFRDYVRKTSKRGILDRVDFLYDRIESLYNRVEYLCEKVDKNDLLIQYKNKSNSDNIFHYLDMEINNLMNKIDNDINYFVSKINRDCFFSSFNHVCGVNNHIYLVENGVEKEVFDGDSIPGLNIYINGNNNSIRINMPINFYRSSIQIGNKGIKIDGVDILLDSPSIFHNVFLQCITGGNQKFSIGHLSRIWGGKIILDESGSCHIGKDCNISKIIGIWGADGHAIIDRKTGKILNKTTHSVEIGDHSWIGHGVRFTKNASIPPHTIVGGGAVVTKRFTEEYTILAGNPAKVIRRNVIRDPLTRSSYQLQREFGEDYIFKDLMENQNSSDES